MAHKRIELFKILLDFNSPIEVKQQIKLYKVY